MIKPTIGRVVWFTPSNHNDPRGDVKQPMVALIAYVWSDRLVNLAAFDQNGAHFGAATAVPLLQDDDEVPLRRGYFAQWMPYQMGQAAKTEQAEAKAAAAGTPSTK